MNKVEIKGTIIKILPEQTINTSTGKSYRKVEIVVETVGEYPKDVCLTFFGKSADLTDKLVEFETVEVTASAESREWNGKYYTNLNAFFVKVTGVANGQVPAPVPVPTHEAEASNETTPETDEDNLPF